MQTDTFQFTQQELKRALVSGEIQHYFQAMVDLRTQHIIGFETLARWQHPGLGLLTSVHFVFELAREHLIPELTQMAIGHAASFYHSTIAQGSNPVPVSINVTAAEIEAPGWEGSLMALMRTLQLPPKFLVIEVLEWGKAQDIDIVSCVAVRLKEAGFSVVADDFGEAYGTFHRLLAIPFSGIKVGSEFTKKLNEKREASIILESLVDLTHKLGISFVVEGVETNDEAQALMALGVRKAQGYLYHRPSPIQGALQQLRPLLKKAA